MSEHAPTTQREAPGDLANPIRLLSTADVRRRIRRGKTWIMTSVREGSFPPPARIGGRLYWPDAEIQAWLVDQLEGSRLPTARPAADAVEKT